MDRRAFLRRTSLALPALLVGDAALLGSGSRVTFTRTPSRRAPYVLLKGTVEDGFGEVATYHGWARGERQVAYIVGKLARRISRERGTPFDAMIPAMTEALS